MLQSSISIHFQEGGPTEENSTMTMLCEESEFSHALILAERIFNRIKCQKKNSLKFQKADILTLFKVTYIRS
jgi:hypothetical protein